MRQKEQSTQGKIYSFCSPVCRKKFDGSPEQDIKTMKNEKEAPRTGCECGGEKAATTTAVAAVTDPVCGMRFASEDAAGRAEFEGQSYYFCAPGCEERFQANPGKFIRHEQCVAAAHWDPVCGMDVTSEDAAGSVEHDGHLYFFCSRS